MISCVMATLMSIYSNNVRCVRFYVFGYYVNVVWFRVIGDSLCILQVSVYFCVFAGYRFCCFLRVFGFGLEVVLV